MPFLTIFVLEFENDIIIFEITALQFANMVEKQKLLNLGLKMPYLGIFGTEFQKLLPYLKSASSNFCAAIKIPKSVPSNFPYCKV